MIYDGESRWREIIAKVEESENEHQHNRERERPEEGESVAVVHLELRNDECELSSHRGERPFPDGLDLPASPKWDSTASDGGRFARQGSRMMRVSLLFLIVRFIRSLILLQATSCQVDKDIF